MLLWFKSVQKSSMLTKCRFFVGETFVLLLRVTAESPAASRVSVKPNRQHCQTAGTPLEPLLLNHTPKGCGGQVNSLGYRNNAKDWVIRIQAPNVATVRQWRRFNDWMTMGSSKLTTCNDELKVQSSPCGNVRYQRLQLMCFNMLRRMAAHQHFFTNFFARFFRTLSKTNQANSPRFIAATTVFTQIYISFFNWITLSTI